MSTISQTPHSLNSQRETPLAQQNLTPTQIAAIKLLFAKGNLTPLMHSTQKRMTEAWNKRQGKEFLAFCSRQLGKSWWALGKAIEAALQGKRVLYFGPVKDKLKDIVADNLDPMLQFAPEGLVRRVRSEYRWYIGTGELRLYPLERAHVDSARGINGDLIVIEEMCFVKSEDTRYAYESVLGPMRQRADADVLIVTTPSADEEHYVHTTILPRCVEQGGFANYTIYDNPFLTHDRIERIKAETTDEAWRREYLAEIFRNNEYMAVPEYEDAPHEFTPPEFANWITCIDFGGSMDPHAIALCYMEPKSDLLRVYREVLLPVNTSIAEIVAACKEIEACIPRYGADGHNPYDGREWQAGDVKGSHTRIADCQGQVSIELSRLGFDHATPSKGPGSFDAHLQGLRVAFKNERITVHKDCVVMREHLRRGRLNKQKTDFDRLEDAKGAKHHCDMIAALMYGYPIRNTIDPTPPTDGRTLATHRMRKQQMAAMAEISKMFEM